MCELLICDLSSTNQNRSSFKDFSAALLERGDVELYTYFVRVIHWISFLKVKSDADEDIYVTSTLPIGGSIFLTRTSKDIMYIEVVDYVHEAKWLTFGARQHQKHFQNRGELLFFDRAGEFFLI